MDVFNLHAFLQYIFYAQWSELRSYANQKNIKIIGDLPIYVAPDSADTWQNPSLFEINPESGQFSHVAGVPPIILMRMDNIGVILSTIGLSTRKTVMIGGSKGYMLNLFFLILCE
jgi:hypothetical protein